MQLVTDTETLEKIDSSEETIEKNKENLIKMIPYFNYKDSCNDIIIKEIQEPSSYKLFDFELSKITQRIYFKLSDEDKKNLKTLLDRLNRQHIIKNSSSYLYDKINSYNWTTEQVNEFVDMKLNEDNKLYDFGNDQLNAIVKSSKYLCISQNPIDLMFASTSQNFGSCYSLTSNYGYAFGLPGLIPNKDTFICFLTKGKECGYEICGKRDNFEFKYMKMLSRFFGYVVQDRFVRNRQRFALGYVYPKENPANMNQDSIRLGWLSDMLRDANIPVIDYPSRVVEGSIDFYDIKEFFAKDDKFELNKRDEFFIPLNKTTGDHWSVYLDNINITGSNYTSDYLHTAYYKCNHGSQSSYTKTGSWSCCSPVNVIQNDRDWEDDILSPEDRHTCIYCDEDFRESEMEYIEGRGYACDECMSNNTSVCDECGNRFDDEDMQNIGDSWYCIDCCRNRSDIIKCDICGAYHDEDDSWYDEETSEHLCPSCKSLYVVTCDECGEEVQKKNTVAIPSRDPETMRDRRLCSDCVPSAVFLKKEFNPASNAYKYKFSISRLKYGEVMSALLKKWGNSLDKVYAIGRSQALIFDYVQVRQTVPPEDIEDTGELVGLRYYQSLGDRADVKFDNSYCWRSEGTTQLTIKQQSLLPLSEGDDPFTATDAIVQTKVTMIEIDWR